MKGRYRGHNFHSQTQSTTIYVMAAGITTDSLSQFSLIFPVYPCLSVGCCCESMYLELLHSGIGGTAQRFSPLHLIEATRLHCVTPWCIYSASLHRDNEVPWWNYLHFLKLSIRSVVQLMKVAGSKPFLSSTLLSFWGNSECQSAFPPHCVKWSPYILALC